MAFGRKWLAEVLQNEDLSTAEKVNALMDGHLAVTDALKAERDEFKTQAEKLPDVQKELDKIKEEAKQFETERKSFEEYKRKVEQGEQETKIREAYKGILEEEGFSAKWVDRIMETVNFSELSLDENGKLSNEKELRDAVNTKWSDVKSTVTEKGASVEKPPKLGKPVKTREEILAIKDTAERQKAIAENHEVFGF